VLEVKTTKSGIEADDTDIPVGVNVAVYSARGKNNRISKALTTRKNTQTQAFI
jgi:hypothetical protein